MKTKNIIILGVAAVLMSGCKSLYGTYERPEVKKDNIVRDPVSGVGYLNAANDTTGFGNLPWRSVFTDAQLQVLIERTLANNPDLLNAALNIDMAEQQLKAAKLAFLPSVVFSPQGTISGFGQSAVNKTYSLPLSASWNVDLFGNLLSQKRSSQMALLAARDYQLAVTTNLICNVANLYYTLLMLDRQLQIVTDMEKLTKETWDMMKLQMQLGRARSTSVQSAEASYYNVQTQGADIRRQIREVENSLSLLMGEPAHGISRGTLENQSLPANFSGGLGIGLLANRPDVHANEMALAQCFYDVETARSRFYPSLTISPTGAFTNSSGGIVNPGKILWSIVGQLTQPIFMKGQLKAGLRVAEDQYKKAYNTWQNSILKAGSEVSNALVQYNSSVETSLLEQKQIDVLKKNVEHTTLLYKQSGSSYLEVITAQQQLLNAEISKVQDDFSKLQAIVNLYYALGGGTK